MNVESHEFGPYEPVSDGTVLAAVERAQRHHDRVPRRLISNHLGFKHSTATTRRLRPQLESLRAEGSLVTERHRSQDYWSLTRLGMDRLAAARRAGRVGPLPESPQHRTWRHARKEAGEHFQEIYEALGDVFEQASRIVGAGVAAASPDQLRELGKRLEWEAWRLEAATYCLHEWAEPDDAQRDKDDGYGAGPVSRRSFFYLGRKSIHE